MTWGRTLETFTFSYLVPVIVVKVIFSFSCASSEQNRKKTVTRRYFIVMAFLFGHKAAGEMRYSRNRTTRTLLGQSLGHNDRSPNHFVWFRERGVNGHTRTPSVTGISCPGPTYRRTVFLYLTPLGDAMKKPVKSRELGLQGRSQQDKKALAHPIRNLYNFQYGQTY